MSSVTLMLVSLCAVGSADDSSVCRQPCSSEPSLQSLIPSQGMKHELPSGHSCISSLQITDTVCDVVSAIACDVFTYKASVVTLADSDSRDIDSWAESPVFAVYSFEGFVPVS